MPRGIKNDGLISVQQHESRNHFKRVSTCQLCAADNKSVVIAFHVKVITPVTQILRRRAFKFVIINNDNHVVDFAGVQIEASVLMKVFIERLEVGLRSKPAVGSKFIAACKMPDSPRRSSK